MTWSSRSKSRSTSTQSQTASTPISKWWVLAAVGTVLAAAGTGLRGIERRLAAFDGTIELSSPPGGPTVTTMEVPCALSSPRTMPSSVTD